MRYLDPDIQSWLHNAAKESPGVWLIQAWRLRESAKRIDWVQVSAEEMLVTAFSSEYRLLIALSVENLIKGILIAEGIRAGNIDPIKGVLNHKLVPLAMKIQTLATPLSEEELQVLDRLTEYIEWAGRYPFPKRVEEHNPVGYSSAEHDLETKIWERLWNHLCDIGWVSKGHPDHEGWYWLLTRSDV